MEQQSSAATANLITDLEDMYMLDPADRYSFVRSVMASDEIWRLPSPADYDAVNVRYMQDSYAGDAFLTRETPADDMFAANDQLFGRLEQCKIMEVDTSIHQPYLRVNLSECSLFVARKDDRLWAAHLGFSQVSQVRAALEHLEQSGFEPSDLSVIASTGAYQEAVQRMGEFSPRLVSVEEYVQLGVKPENITTFAYQPPQQESSDRHRSLCEVTVGTDGMLVTTFDADIRMRHGFVSETVDQTSVEERFIPA